MTETNATNGSNGAAESGGGNTKTPPVKRASPSKYWLFTLNNYTKEDEEKIGSIGAIKGNYIYGHEIAPTTGTPHLQGFIAFHKKERPMEVFGIPRMHWTKKSPKATVQDNINYCSKDGEDIRTNCKAWLPKKRMPVKKFDEITLRGWQIEAEQACLKLCEDDRKILWIYDEGNTGKSWFARYLVEEYDAVLLSGASKYCLSTVYKMDTKPSTIIYAFPRDKEQYVSYGALEALRDGLFFSGFGTDGTGMCNLGYHPLVIVLCNFYPDVTKFTEDRWDIRTIENDQLIECEVETPICLLDSED